MLQSTRTDLRAALAEEISSLPYSKLREWNITRVADVTGLDTIGLPVWTACRPPGKVITISAGKGLTKVDAKAGAILEGVELHVAENPNAKDPWVYGPFSDIKGAKIPIDFLPVSRHVPFNEGTPIAWEPMTDVFRDSMVAVPSDLLWLSQRIRTPFDYMQSSSNGIAAGVSYEDALLQGAYEVIERDGWAISDFIREQTGRWPPRVSTDGLLPDQVKICIERLSEAKISPFIFDLSTDLQVPIFGCVILDPAENSPGAFSGFGCSLDTDIAARRAITEACQARAVYISGGRDDMFRRKFLQLKNVRSKQLFALYNSLPVAKKFPISPSIDSVENEWATVNRRLQQFGISECYSRVLYESDDPSFIIVRVICPMLSSAPWENWTPNDRCRKAIKTVT
jgi:YcaO-like protein with predicted kinase domain